MSLVHEMQLLVFGAYPSISSDEEKRIVRVRLKYPEAIRSARFSAGYAAQDQGLW